MKRLLAICLSGGLLALSAACVRVEAQVSFTAGIQINSPSDFYQPLSTLGTWVNLPPYGYCWHPWNVEPDWRPYTVGHWEWTDVGWYWASDEPWAWATYHYGSWIFDPYYGWLWIPGTEWAPSWVVWRESDDYVGWAPCAPAGIALAPSFFVFVDFPHFHGHFHRSSFLVNNRAIFERSHRVGRLRRERRVFDGAERHFVRNEGPGIDRVQRATGTRFRTMPVQQAVRETPRPWDARRGTYERRFEGERRAPAVTTTPDRRQRQTPTETQPAPSNVRPAPQPTGREQPRIYQQRRTQPATAPRFESGTPSQPTAPAAPVVPTQPVAPQRPTIPTGREQPRIYQQRRTEPATRFESVTPSQPTVPTAPLMPTQPAPPQRPTTPTGREPGFAQPTAPSAPTVPVQPAVPQRPTTPTGREREFTQPTVPSVPTAPQQPVTPAPPAVRSVPVPAPAPINPAGHERGFERPTPGPPQPERPREFRGERPQGPPPGQERKDDRDRP